MIRKNEILFVFGSLLIIFCKQTSSECRQLTSCSCMFSNWEGYSLMPLVNSRFINSTEQNYTFFFHPCTNKLLSDNVTSECSRGNGASLCAAFNNTTFVLGKAEETKIVFEGDDLKPPVFMFHHKNYTTKIALSCCSSCETRLYVESLNTSRNEYHLLLTSIYACKTLMHSKGLSIGSTLLIYLFVISGIYFIGGALTLKFLRGATGWEMMPNHSFWQSLPSLVKDGISFTFNCCRLDSYERI
ncbi:cation-dependent mannose-6-phosphate receptor [Bombus fervidus]|uniref:cation-dependent mannose-6-phosphate receptor n=1 Tax=Bombus fervidus TaxID=203811 RepID=UPI003AB2C548